MRLRRTSNGELVTVSQALLLGAGGEARIYGTAETKDLAAKIYHRPSLERAQKLRVMMANPPEEPAAGGGHTSIAWPIDLLAPPENPANIVGFLMPRVQGMNPVIDFYHPKTRRERYPLFSYRYLVRTARNLAGCVSALHARGYLIGDLNESNILVGETALVTLVDTDSFQVPDLANRRVYRCRVGKPEFTAPELQNVGFALVDRSQEHDLFALAVLIFQLLMEGTHPFAGRHIGLGEPPSLEERIAAGHFPHIQTPAARYMPMPTAPRFDFLPTTVRGLFAECFIDGHSHPSSRPDARRWQMALEEAESSLRKCATNHQHRYASHLPDCPWCRRKRLLGGLDPFPSRADVIRGTALGFRRRSPARQRSHAIGARIPPGYSVASSDRETWPVWVWAGALVLNLLFFVYVLLSSN